MENIAFNMGESSMKRIVAIILALVLLTTPVTAQVCDLTKAKTEMTAKTGIYEYKGHWYLYIGGKMQYGKIKFTCNLVFQKITLRAKDIIVGTCVTLITFEIIVNKESDADFVYPQLACDV